MPPKPRVNSRQIFTDESFAGDSFISGLGNANLSSTLTVAENIQPGIKLGSAVFDNIIEPFTPAGREKTRLEREKRIAAIEQARKQAEVDRIEAEFNRTNRDVILEQKRQDISAKKFSAKNALAVSRAVTESREILDQSRDPNGNLDPFTLEKVVSGDLGLSALQDPEYKKSLANQASGMLRRGVITQEQALALDRALQFLPEGERAKAELNREFKQEASARAERGVVIREKEFELKKDKATGSFNSLKPAEKLAVKALGINSREDITNTQVLPNGDLLVTTADKERVVKPRDDSDLAKALRKLTAATASTAVEDQLPDEQTFRKVDSVRETLLSRLPVKFSRAASLVKKSSSPEVEAENQARSLFKNPTPEEVNLAKEALLLEAGV